MEVTSNNFNDILPEFEETVNNCTFLAIDCEFSGLHAVSEVNAYDTPKQYYEKIRKNCRDFLVIQCGISVFRFEEDTGEFKQNTFNFYVFRKPVNRNIPDQRFLCQTSSINFLTEQGFDFNKLFKFGIPYLNVTEEAAYKNGIEERRKSRLNSVNSQNSDHIPIPDDIQPQITDILQLIDNFLEKSEEELILPKCNAFVRRLIYQTASQDKYKSKILVKTIQKNNDRLLAVTRFVNSDHLAQMEKKMWEEELNLMENFIGFSKIMKIIVKSEKMVVGHNMCLDFFHTIDKFLTPLSENYQEFKECAHSLFPKIIDTKYMSQSEPFKDLIKSTILNDLYETLSAKQGPFEIPVNKIENCGYNVTERKEHEAGFDAFLTGLCFMAMWHYLGKTNFPNTSVLEPYLNRIFLMTLRDNQFINLAGEDSNPSRDHVFHLTFPKDWKTNNICQLFSPFGNVHVAWINDMSAYVGLVKKNQSSSVILNTLSQSDVYKIQTFANRQQLTKNTIVASPSCQLVKGKRKLADGLEKTAKKLKMDTILEEQNEETPKRACRKMTFPESDWD